MTPAKLFRFRFSYFLVCIFKQTSFNTASSFGAIHKGRPHWEGGSPKADIVRSAPNAEKEVQNSQTLLDVICVWLQRGIASFEAGQKSNVWPSLFLDLNQGHSSLRASEQASCPLPIFSAEDIQFKSVMLC